MKNLFTTIAALALAVASYGQVNTVTGTVKETFTGSFSGNYYCCGNIPSTWNLQVAGTPYISFYDDAYNAVSFTGVNGVRPYSIADESGVSGNASNDELGFYSTTPAPASYGKASGLVNGFDNDIAMMYMFGGAFGNSQSSIILGNATATFKVTNKSTTSSMSIRIGFKQLAGFINVYCCNPTTDVSSSVLNISANTTQYVSLTPPADVIGIVIRTVSFTGAGAIDDVRLGYALPTAVTPLIEANNSTTVDRFGTLTFAIPSVTGSVEYANETPSLSVSPSTLGTIDQTGVFTAGATGGVVTITAASYGVNSSYVVTISSVIYATNATVSGVAALTVGGVTNYSISNITPSNAQVPTSTVWVSSNPAVATINGTSGALKAIGAGTTNIYSLLVLSNGTTINIAVI